MNRRPDRKRHRPKTTPSAGAVIKKCRGTLKSPATINSPQQAQPGPDASKPQSPAEFITKDEVAKRLRKTQRTIEKWQRTGLIPYIKIGWSILYNWPELGEHLQRRFRVAPKPPPPRSAGEVKESPRGEGRDSNQ